MTNWKDDFLAGEHTDESELPLTSWSLELNPPEDLVFGEKTPPRLLEREDGNHLLYPGEVHWFQGEPESLKSFLAQVAVVQELEADRPVLYLDYESRAPSVGERLQAMATDQAAMLQRLMAGELKYRALRHRLGDVLSIDPMSRGAQKDLETTLVAAQGCSLVVLDGVTDSMSLEGLDSSSNPETATWLHRLPNRLAAETGAAVVCVDHVTKSREDRGRYAIGAQHKLAGVGGASFGIQVLKPLARADDEPITGKARIVVAKDRPGHVRAISTLTETNEHVAATLEITSYPDERLEPRLTAEAPELVDDLEAEVLRIVQDYGEVSLSVIGQLLGLSAIKVGPACEALRRANKIDPVDGKSNVFRA